MRNVDTVDTADTVAAAAATAATATATATATIIAVVVVITHKPLDVRFVDDEVGRPG